MTLQSACMAGLFLLCVISAIDWVRQGEYMEGLAFALFGCGDLALAWVLRHGANL